MPHVTKGIQQRPPLLKGRTPCLVLLEVPTKGLHDLCHPAKIWFPKFLGRRIGRFIVVFAVGATVVDEADGCVAFVGVVDPCVAEGTVDVCVEDVVSGWRLS